jgi:hypothetical protein
MEILANEIPLHEFSDGNYKTCQCVRKIMIYTAWKNTKRKISYVNIMIRGIQRIKQDKHHDERWCAMCCNFCSMKRHES